MADQNLLLLQPFLAKPVTKPSTSEPDSSILLRTLFLLLIGAISLWANHEASKGFSITIINETKDSLSGKRFDLFFKSDDTAVRILLDTSSFVQRVLYEGVPHRLRKLVTHVTVRFCDDKVERFSVTSGASNGEYVIRLSSSLMERSDVEFALRRSMVKIWLWGDNKTGASSDLVAGIVEYLAVKSQKRRRSFKDKEYVNVVRLLDYCERRSEGFIRRLNHGMRIKWDDRTVDLASNGACESRKDMLREVKVDDDNGVYD